MINKNKQRGVGLIEVLVSLLLLSVAVLGFSTLQMTSVKATDESLKRTQAMNVARGLAESLRLNTESIDKVREVINDKEKAGEVGLDSCQTVDKSCTSEELAVKDALTVIENAQNYGVKIGMEVCPNTTPAIDSSIKDEAIQKAEQKMGEVACIIVAWNTTNSFTDASDKEQEEGTINCANNKGEYYPNADCMILEAY